MAGIVVLLVIVTISLIATRVAAVALSMTGVSHDLARFQSRSASSGVGFTTNEAERMMDHPVRRRIVMALMLAGNAGLVTVGTHRRIGRRPTARRVRQPAPSGPLAQRPG